MSLDRLVAIMRRLRDPQRGCEWDSVQTFATIAPYTIEEAYEVADAIARGDLDDLRDELGDLLLQVVYHAQMAQEVGEFAFGDVVQAIRVEYPECPSAAGVPERRSGGRHSSHHRALF